MAVSLFLSFTKGVSQYWDGIDEKSLISGVSHGTSIMFLKDACVPNYTALEDKATIDGVR